MRSELASDRLASRSCAERLCPGSELAGEAREEHLGLPGEIVGHAAQHELG